MNNPQDGEVRKEPNGTTVVAIKTKDGAVIASDTKTSSFISTFRKDSKKITPIHDRVLMGTAGVVGHLQKLKLDIQNEASIYESKRGYEMPTKSVAHVARNKFDENHYHVSALIIGFDDKPEVYFAGGAGSIMEFDDYTCVGSGGSFAFGVLEQSYRYDMSIEDAKILARDAIRTAHERDNMSGNGLIIGTVTKDGHDITMYEDIPEEL